MRDTETRRILYAEGNGQPPLVAKTQVQPRYYGSRMMTVSVCPCFSVHREGVDIDARECMRFVVFPSFTPTQLHQLQQLYRNRSNSAEGVITFWKTRLKADREEVAACIEYQRETTKGQPARAAPAAIASDHTPSLSLTSPTDPFVRTHLPTRAESPSANKLPECGFLPYRLSP